MAVGRMISAAVKAAREALELARKGGKADEIERARRALSHAEVGDLRQTTPARKMARKNAEKGAESRRMTQETHARKKRVERMQDEFKDARTHRASEELITRQQESGGGWSDFVDMVEDTRPATEGGWPTLPKDAKLGRLDLDNIPKDWHEVTPEMLDSLPPEKMTPALEALLKKDSRKRMRKIEGGGQTSPPTGDLKPVKVKNPLGEDMEEIGLLAAMGGGTLKDVLEAFDLFDPGAAMGPFTTEAPTNEQIGNNRLLRAILGTPGPATVRGPDFNPQLPIVDFGPGSDPMTQAFLAHLTNNP